MRLGDIINICTTTVYEQDSLDTILEKFKRSALEFLPIIDNKGLCIGSIYLDDLQRASPNHFSINEFTKTVHASETAHIIEAIRKCLRHGLSGIPVIDDEDYLMGYVLLNDLFQHFARSSGLMENGSMIIIETQQNNYSLAEISKIIESNGASILHQYTSSHPDSQLIQITMILNTIQLNDIIASLERFKYSVLYYSSSTEREDLMKERYDSLMHYLEI